MFHSDPQELVVAERLTQLGMCSYQSDDKVENDRVTIKKEKGENTFVEEEYDVARVTVSLKTSCPCELTVCKCLIANLLTAVPTSQRHA